MTVTSPDVLVQSQGNTTIHTLPMATAPGTSNNNEAMPIQGVSNGIPLNTINPTGTGTIFTNQVSVGTGNTSIVAARGGSAGTGRVAITLINMGTAIVYIGNTGLTVGNGMPLPPNSAITLEYQGAVFGISGTAAQTVGYIETV